MPDFDTLDALILDLLQDNGRLSNANLAKLVSLSEASCWRRVKRLEEKGVIAGYQAVLDRRNLGLGVYAFVQLGCDEHSPEVAAELVRVISGSSHVLACHNTTGEADFLLQVVAKDLDDYSRFVETVLRSLPGVKSVTSNLSLKEMKLTNHLPVPAPGRPSSTKLPQSAQPNAER